MNSPTHSDNPWARPAGNGGPGPGIQHISVDPQLVEQVQSDVARVDEFIRRHINDHEVEFIRQASGHLFEAGGKRFRPMVTVLASYVGGSRRANDQVIAAAAGVELTHLASLYHDDVMDEAEVRRGVPSSNVAYGNSISILVGDLLFGKASAIVAQLGAEAVRLQADTFVRLCSGQIRDTLEPQEDDDPLDYYLRVLEDKTGSLIATAAVYGGTYGGASASEVEILRKYGEQVGLAFQLADDILDVASDAGESGKVPGTDLREGVDTLQTILVRRAGAAEDARLLQLLDADLTDDALHAEALALLRAHPSLDRARQITQGVAQDAGDLLEPLANGPVADALRALALSSVERVK